MERMDGRTDGRDGQTGAGGRGRTRTDGGSEERPGEQVMLFRGWTDARAEREREEGTTASGGAAPALPVRGRKRAPPTAAGRPQWRSIIE